MKNYPHIISKVYGEPWVITPDKHLAIRTLLETRLGESVGTGNFYHSYDGKTHGVEPPEDYDYPEPQRFGNTYVIPVYGIIGKHLSSLELACGGCSLDTVAQMLKVARNDSSIDHIILHFDSPGGTVVGVPEAAKLIADIAEEKEVTAYCECLCASGAYWLASQANQFVCTESAAIGSIGVYAVYFDETAALAKEGVKVNPISAGEFKLSGAYFKPMTETERNMFQDRVDGIYKKFKEACTSKRHIDDSVMQGQVLCGTEAANVGLVDGIVEDLEELL
jgi:signal peptide peptidase SppA